MAQIATQIVSSKTAVINALRRYAIPIREAHKPHGRISQPRFGKKKIKGKITIHAQETRVIGMIKHLRLEGLTYRKIAKILTEMKIPTKKRGQKWHPEMVRRIIEM